MSTDAAAQGGPVTERTVTVSEGGCHGLLLPAVTGLTITISEPPRCAQCGQQGHTYTSCPVLAQLHHGGGPGADAMRVRR